MKRWSALFLISATGFATESPDSAFRPITGALNRLRVIAVASRAEDSRRWWVETAAELYNFQRLRWPMPSRTLDAQVFWPDELLEEPPLFMLVAEEGLEEAVRFRLSPWPETESNYSWWTPVSSSPHFNEFRSSFTAESYSIEEQRAGRGLSSTQQIAKCFATGAESGTG